MNTTVIVLISASTFILGEFLAYTNKHYSVKYNLDKIVITTIKALALVLPIVALSATNEEFEILRGANNFKLECIDIQDSLIVAQDDLIDELCDHDWEHHNCDIPVLDGETKLKVDKWAFKLDSLYMTQL